MQSPEPRIPFPLPRDGPAEEDDDIEFVEEDEILEDDEDE